MNFVIFASGEFETSNKTFTEIQLPYYRPRQGLVFVYKTTEGDSPFPKLNKILVDQKRKRSDLIEEIPKHKLIATEYGISDDKTAFQYRVADYFKLLPLNDQQREIQIIPPSYRHERQLIHQCLGIGFSHPPQVKTKEFEFDKVKVILGTDHGFSQNTLAFVDSELFTKFIDSFEKPENRKISIFVNRNYQEPIYKGGLSEDAKYLIELIQEVCDGKHGDQGYLQFEKRGTKSAPLIHNAAFVGLQ